MWLPHGGAIVSRSQALSLRMQRRPRPKSTSPCRMKRNDSRMTAACQSVKLTAMSGQPHEHLIFSPPQLAPHPTDCSYLASVQCRICGRRMVRFPLSFEDKGTRDTPPVSSFPLSSKKGREVMANQEFGLWL